MPDLVIPCVGAIIIDELGRLLLIKRGHEPGAGLWSIPGGRVEPGESDTQALVRELREETGLTVKPGALAGTVRRRYGSGVLLIRDYLATVVDGSPVAGEPLVAGGSGVAGRSLVAGDDAAEARWVDVGELDQLPLTEGLLDALRSWGVLNHNP